MKLKLYLNQTNTPVAEFAAKIGVARQTVYAWLREEKRPNGCCLAKIKEVTKKKVTADDFY